MYTFLTQTILEFCPKCKITKELMVKQVRRDI